jgi:hypothetical protein
VCAQLVPNGFRICVVRDVVATQPATGGGPHECDGAHPCAQGRCYAILAFPSGVCGLGGASPGNLCLADQCASDADCAGGEICGPAGLSSDSSESGGAARECFKASCHGNADCTARPGGVCAFVAGHCARYVTFVRGEVACIYPDGCASSADCCGGTCGTCQVVDGEGVCVM